MTHYTFTDYIGLIGVAITLIAYFLLNIRKIDPRSWQFPSYNAIGSTLILYSLIYKWNPASWWMEICWLLISLYGVAEYFYRLRDVNKRKH